MGFRHVTSRMQGTEFKVPTAVPGRKVQRVRTLGSTPEKVVPRETHSETRPILQRTIKYFLMCPSSLRHVEISVCADTKGKNENVVTRKRGVRDQSLGAPNYHDDYVIVPVTTSCFRSSVQRGQCQR